MEKKQARIKAKIEELTKNSYALMTRVLKVSKEKNWDFNVVRSTLGTASHWQIMRVAGRNDRTGSLQDYQTLQTRLTGLDSDMKTLYRGKLVELRARLERV